MRGAIPIEELNIKDFTKILKEVKELQDDKLEKKQKDFIKDLDKLSLNDIANYKYCVYKPILFNFGYILNRMKSDLVNDSDTESLQIKLDIAEQLSNLEQVPSLNTECHIESRYLDKNTSFKSFILKTFFGQRKYKLIFHKEEATFDEMYYKKYNKGFKDTVVLLEFMLLILSILLRSAEFLAIMYLVIIITLFLVVLLRCMD